MSTDVFTFAKLHRQMHCKIFTVSMELVGRLWTALVSRQDWLCDVTKTLPLSRQRELISTSIQWNDLPSPFLSDIEITLYGSYFRKLSPVSIVSIPAALFFFFFFFWYQSVRFCFVCVRFTNSSNWFNLWTSCGSVYRSVESLKYVLIVMIQFVRRAALSMFW